MHKWETPAIKGMRMARPRNICIWLAFIVAMIIVVVQYELPAMAIISLIAVSFVTMLLHDHILRHIDGQDICTRVDMVESLNTAVLKSLEVALSSTEDESARSTMIWPLIDYLIHPIHSESERKEVLSWLQADTLACVEERCQARLVEERSLTPLPNATQQEIEKRDDLIYALATLLRLFGSKNETVSAS